MGIQGDVAFTRVDELPEGLVESKTEDGKLIVAHSETGHNHAFDDNDNVTVLEDPSDPLISYIQVSKEAADLVHYRSYDTHETVRFEPGIYKVNRQREHTPEGWRKVSD